MYREARGIRLHEQRAFIRVDALEDFFLGDAYGDDFDPIMYYVDTEDWKRFLMCSCDVAGNTIPKTLAIRKKTWDQDEHNFGVHTGQHKITKLEVEILDTNLVSLRVTDLYKPDGTSFVHELTYCGPFTVWWKSNETVS
jgi:hypothetical protein